MKVLVTGAAGKLGRVASQALREAGHEVRGTDQRYDRESGSEFVVADLRRYTDAYALVRGVEAVVHLGNYPNIAVGLPPQNVYAENTAMNVNVFQAALDLGVRRLIFASSIQTVCGDRAFGDGQPSGLAYLPLDGGLPQRAGNLYGLSKIAGEVLLRHYAERHPDLAATALRFPYLVPSSSDWRLSRRWREIRPGVRLDEGFTYLFFPDAARLIVAIVERQQAGYHCYLPAATTPSTAIPVAELVRDYFPGVPLRRPVEEMTGLVDLSRIAADVGWAPRERLPVDEEPPATAAGE